MDKIQALLQTQGALESSPSAMREQGQLMATATFKERASALKAVKTLPLGEPKVGRSSEAWRGQSNRGRCLALKERSRMSSSAPQDVLLDEDLNALKMLKQTARTWSRFIDSCLFA